MIEKLFKVKHPVVKQYDQIDCGPACLLSVLQYYGGNTNFVKVREMTGTDSKGSTMLGLVQAANKMGFNAHGAKGEYNDLMKESMPCIAHVILKDGLQHFVVVYKIDEKGVFIADPGKGKYSLSRDDFCEIWKERVVVLLTPAQPVLNETTSHWFNWILKYLVKQEAWVTQSLFLGITYTLLGLVTGITTKK